MTFQHVVKDGSGGEFTEIIEDVTLAAALERGDKVSFVVTDDQWSEDFNVRTVRRAEILEHH